MNIKYYFPKWIFPHNIGDSVNATFVPKVIKKLYPDSKIEVITSGFLIDVFKNDPSVDSVRHPQDFEYGLDYRGYAFSDKKSKTFLTNFPDWHPNLFKFWGENSDFLINHKTCNLITINFLLQLGLEKLVFDENFDFREDFYYTPKPKIKSQKINVGIVPATKLAGRPFPHPGCNGIGLRFNGPNGVNSWRSFVDTLKKLNENVVIHEFSPENFGLGDYHYPHSENIFDLVDQVDLCDIGVMSDGGLHHVFNSRNKPVVLFQATTVNKSEFFKLENSFFPEELHLSCRKTCRSYFSESLGVEDKSQSCKLECENLNPEDLAKYTNKIISEFL